MLVKQLVDEDFINYRKPSMFVGTAKCSMKCELEAGKPICQNNELIQSRGIPMSPEDLYERYKGNRITKAIVFGGLEPFDTSLDLYMAIREFRKHTQDDIIIYSGYTEEELLNMKLLQPLMEWDHIIIKFGRFIPDRERYWDKFLGVWLASDNQRARTIEVIRKEYIEMKEKENKDEYDF